MANSYVWKLVLIVSISGATTGFDTGIMAGGVLYLRKTFPTIDANDLLLRWFVSTAPIGAIIGAVLATSLNDAYGRREALKISNYLYIIGTVIFILSKNHAYLFVGRLITGLGIGTNSVTCPLYIAEGSHPLDRAQLIVVVLMMLPVGRFFAGVAASNLKDATGTWRLMFACAMIFPIMQLAFIKLITESPFWRLMMIDWAGARAIFEKIYAPNNAGDDEDPDAVAIKIEIDNLIIQGQRTFLDEQPTRIGRNIFTNIWAAFHTKGMLSALMISICAQGMQLLLGINTVLYYSDHLLQSSGMAFSEFPTQISAMYVFAIFFGSLFSYFLITRCPKRLLMMLSTCSTILTLIIYSILFVPQMGGGKIDYLAMHQVPKNIACASYELASNQSSWTCTSCLKSKCEFCAPRGAKYHASGICVASSKDALGFCTLQDRKMFNLKCPIKYGTLNSWLLIGYLVVYSSGLATVPWVMTTELFPTRYRALGGAVSATMNWLSIILVRMLGSGNVETIVACIFISFISMCYLWKKLPETHGVGLDEVLQLFNPSVENSPASTSPGSNSSPQNETSLNSPPENELVPMGRDQPSQGVAERDEIQDERTPLIEKPSQFDAGIEETEDECMRRINQPSHEDFERDVAEDERMPVKRRGRGRGRLAGRGGHSLGPDYSLIRGRASDQDRPFSW